MQSNQTKQNNKNYIDIVMRYR